MSSIDDRIVDMQFNSDSFEKNIESSVKSLATLNDALQLKDASNGLDAVQQSMQSMDLSTIADGVQNISSKFTVFGAIGLSVINTLTNALLGFAGTSIDAIMDPLIEGGKRRAQNIEQAKFMIGALGKSWTALYKDMDYAVAGTAYGIDQAAKAASQLSASSVKAGSQMKGYLRGISGVAAMTGSSYDEIAQIFTTVAGNGRVMASELNRISQRGVNAAQVLAKYFNEGRKGAKLTEADIREMASKGKISADDFAKAMDGAFGASATRANELYSGSLSNVNAALSRLGEKFATPFFEKQRNIFNQLRLVINGVSQALGPFITLWGDVQKLQGEVMVGFLKEVEKSVGILSTSPNTLYNKELAAYEKYKADKGLSINKGKKIELTAEAAAGKKHLEAQDKLLKAEAAAQKKYDKAKAKYNAGGKKGPKPKMPKILVDKKARAAKGTTQESTPITQSISAVTEGLRTLGMIAKTVFDTISGAFADVFPKDPAAKSLLLTLADAFKTLAVYLYPSNEQLSIFRKVLIGFFTALKAVGTVVSVVFGAIPGIFQVIVGVFKLLGAIFRPLIDFTEQLAKSFMAMFDSAGQGSDVIKNVGDALSWLRDNGLGTLLGMIDNATKAITTFWENMGSGSGGNLFEGFDPFKGMLENLKSFAATMAGFFSNAWEWAKGIYESISGAMGQFGSGAGGFFTGFGETMRKIDDWISQSLKDLKGGFAEFFKGFDWTTLLAGLSSGVFIGIMAKAFLSIRNFFKITDDIKEFVKLLKKGVLGAIDQLTGTLKTMQNEIKTRMIVNIAIAVGILAAAFWILSKVDLKGADTAAIAMTMILMEVMGALYIMTQMNTDKGIIKMTGLASALVILSVALLVMANAAKILSSIDPARLGKSMISLAFGMTMMIVALSLLNDMDPKTIILGAVAMNILANALIVMAAAVGILGLMPLDVLVQGGIAITGLMALLIIFAAIPSENVLKAGVAVGIMANSLLLMVAAIGILGIMPMATLIQGGIALAVMMTGLVIAVNMLKGAESGAAAMMGMAVALLLLIVPVKMFADMDSGKLAQGIGSTIILLIGLVGAANMMQKAVPGAAAMITMAFAILILAGAVWVMAQIPGDQLAAVFLMIAGSLGVLLLAAWGAQAVAPGLFILAGAILAIGLAVALAGAGVIMMSIGFATLGYALQAAIPGLMAFAVATGQMLPYLASMIGLGIALGVLALAVGGLGLAFILLGTGLIMTGAGLAILAAVGGMGAIAVLAVWKALEPLLGQLFQIAALGAAFGVLGAGLLLFGGGLALVALATAAMAIAMFAFVGAGFSLAATIDSVRAAFERYVPVAGLIDTQVVSLQNFGNQFRTLNIALSTISSDLTTAATGFQTFADKSSGSAKAIGDVATAVEDTNSRSNTAFGKIIATFTRSAVSIGQSSEGLGTQVQNGSKTLDTALNAILTNVKVFADKLSTQSTIIDAAAIKMLGTLGTTITTKLSGIKPSLKTEATSVGKYVDDGFKNGINDGSNSVVDAAKAMARRVIQAVKDEMKIKSPSKVMEELGKYTAEGFYKGLTGFEDAPITLPPPGGANRHTQSKDYWTPKNYDGGSSGAVTLRRALENSKTW